MKSAGHMENVSGRAELEPKPEAQDAAVATLYKLILVFGVGRRREVVATGQKSAEVNVG